MLVLLLAVAGCAGTTAPADPESDIAALADLASAHREEVQVETDLGAIADLETGYRDRWHEIADPCAREMADRCDAPTDGSLGAPDWIAAGTDLVDQHAADQATMGSFQGCWMAEDGHHDDISGILDSLAEAWSDLCD